MVGRCSTAKFDFGLLTSNFPLFMNKQRRLLCALAVELSVAVEADLAFHRSKWFVPVGRTFYCYQDWAVAMAHHGAVYLPIEDLRNRCERVKLAKRFRSPSQLTPAPSS